MYFLRSGVTGEFMRKAYTITEHTDKREFNRYFQENLVYVARHLFEDEIPVEIERIEEAQTNQPTEQSFWHFSNGQRY
ncbi:hypothetical protein [Flavobacterium sp. 3HN19-14]|uniref:hypothetical protein n=1 Tax=Flavobacterium sp. 3HN19-14 TaxID=3448133 RepID=UPI003EE3296E